MSNARFKATWAGQFLPGIPFYPNTKPTHTQISTTEHN